MHIFIARGDSFWCVRVSAPFFCSFACRCHLHLFSHIFFLRSLAARVLHPKIWICYLRCDNLQFHLLAFMFIVCCLSCTLHICLRNVARRPVYMYQPHIFESKATTKKEPNAKRIEIHKQIYGDAFNNMTMTYEWGVLFANVCAFYVRPINCTFIRMTRIDIAMRFNGTSASYAKLYAYNDARWQRYLPFIIYFKCEYLCKSIWFWNKTATNFEIFFAVFIVQNANVWCHFRFSWFLAFN